ncbi:MAG: dicarboxylate/amino acid:cation symporter [Bdellovibrionales bacterium]|nr:dicarboxylate/amino acid:cation symporter [Bdellovibrionales bacterium]
MNIQFKSPLYSIKNVAAETKKLIENHLWAKILVFLFLGLITGFLLGPQMNWVSPKVSSIITDWLVVPGKIFLTLMQMIIIPLVLSSVVLGVLNSESLELLRKIAIRLVPYFILTTIISILIGFFVAETIRPGDKIDKSQIKQNVNIQESVIVNETKNSSLPDTLTSILPKNPAISIVEGELFQVVIFALIIGVALLSISKEQAEPIINLLTATQHLSMVVVGWAMKLAPIAVFGLMSELLASVGSEVLYGIGSYILSVVLALLGILIVYMLIIGLGAQKNPFKVLREIRPLQLLAFSTSSSAAVMPLTLETVEKKLGVSNSVSRFVIPIGTTINMDGTAAYQGVAACFIAQAYGLDLSMAQIALIVASATGASIGAPGTPGVGTAILASILKGIGIPAEGVLLVMSVDRILDMLRTVINVTGDVTASLFFNRWIK